EKIPLLLSPPEPADAGVPDRPAAPQEAHRLILPRAQTPFPGPPWPAGTTAQRPNASRARPRSRPVAGFRQSRVRSAARGSRNPAGRRPSPEALSRTARRTAGGRQAIRAGRDRGRDTALRWWPDRDRALGYRPRASLRSE